jgi:hypothetical protein
MILLLYFIQIPNQKSEESETLRAMKFEISSIEKFTTLVKRSTAAEYPY